MSYQDQPLFKPPVWTWEIPTYFFIGGAAGAAAMIGVAAKDEKLVRDARWIAAIGANLSTPLLIADLGRPERFLNMLRVFNPQSPMSVGAWTVAVFGGASTATLLFPIFAPLAALTGLGMATYTGVLLGVTAIPVWKENARVLPVHFAASALGTACSILELCGHKQRALNSLALGAAIFECFVPPAASRPERRLPGGGQDAGWQPAVLAELLSGPVPFVLRLIGKRKAAAAATILGSLLTRFAWVEAGKVSARRSASTTSDPAASDAKAVPPAQSPDRT